MLFVKGMEVRQKRPVMTIKSVKGQTVTCKWIDDDGMEQTDDFDASQLEKARRPRFVPIAKGRPR
jgi:uncharacterized protein YodC (DUF2158 family)